MSAPQQPSRREFLAVTSTAASTMLLPRTRLQDPIAAAPPNRAPIRLGFVGMGKRGTVLLKSAFLPEPEVRVVAVCDVDENRCAEAKKVTDAHQGDTDCATYANHRELLRREDVDAVVIATPDHWHANQIIDASVAGKDIYCEKPLTLTLRESQIVIEAVRKYGCVFQTGSQQRTEFDQRFVTACELVRNGRIGKILQVHVGVGDPPGWCDLPEEEMEPRLDWDRWLGPAPRRPYNSELSPRGVHRHFPRFRLYREYAGGALADMGAHHFDIVQWALKRDDSGPVHILPPQDAEAKRGATLIYADGTRLTHGGPSGATFLGTEGLLHVDRDRLLSVPKELLEQSLGDDDERLPRKRSHAGDWLDCIRERTRPICDVEVGARSAAICHLMNIAYWHRRELRWDPQTWSFDSESANELRDYQRRDAYALPSF